TNVSPCFPTGSTCAFGVPTVCGRRSRGEGVGATRAPVQDCVTTATSRQRKDRMPPRDHLADLSASEFVAAILTDLDRRPAFATVRDQLAPLLAMGPTLTAVTEAGVGQLVEQALAAARAAIAEQNVVLGQPMLTAVDVAEAV